MVDPSSVNLTWFTYADDARVTVMPSFFIADDSIGNTFTTVIQFDYLMESDEGNYTCTLTREKDSVTSAFELKLVSKQEYFHL